MTVIDPLTKKIDTTIPVGERAHGIAYDPAPANRNMYVTNFVSDTVSEIDSATNTVFKDIKLPANSTPVGIAYDPANGKMYVTSLSGSVYVIPP